VPAEGSAGEKAHGVDAKGDTSPHGTGWRVGGLCGGSEMDLDLDLDLDLRSEGAEARAAAPRG